MVYMAKARQPNAEEKRHHAKVRELGCIICVSPTELHHAGTGMGGRKDHMRVIPLCYHHHRGAEGIHTLSRRVWQEKYGTEQFLLDRIDLLLYGD